LFESKLKAKIKLLSLTELTPLHSLPKIYFYIIKKFVTVWYKCVQLGGTTLNT